MGGGEALIFPIVQTPGVKEFNGEPQGRLSRVGRRAPAVVALRPLPAVASASTATDYKPEAERTEALVTIISNANHSPKERVDGRPDWRVHIQEHRCRG